MKTIIISILFLVFISFSLKAQEIGKDQVFLLNGDILSGTLVEVSHNHYVRLMVDDRYLEPFLYKHIEKVIQNQTHDKPVDIVSLKSGDRIKGIIIEIVPKEKIEFVSDFTGDTLEIENQNIIKIYHSKKKLPKKIRMAYLGDYHYLSISPGIGITRGGLGGRIQYRIGKDFGVGVHAGTGINGENFFGAPPYFNVGVKLFFLNFLYINANYGTLGTYYKKDYSTYYYGEEKAYNYYGYGFMFGADYFINKQFGFTFSYGLAYNKSFIYERNVIDFGVVFKLALRPQRKNKINTF